MFEFQHYLNELSYLHQTFMKTILIKQFFEILTIRLPYFFDYINLALSLLCASRKKKSPFILNIFIFRFTTIFNLLLFFTSPHIARFLLIDILSLKCNEGNSVLCPKLSNIIRFFLSFRHHHFIVVIIINQSM